MIRHDPTWLNAGRWGRWCVCSCGSNVRSCDHPKERTMMDPYAETDEWPTPHVPAQDRLLTDFPCCEAPADTSDGTDGRVSRDDLLLAYDRLSRENVELQAGVDVAVREARAAVPLIVQANERAADFEGRYEVAHDARMMAERESDTLRAELRALREGIEALPTRRDGRGPRYMLATDVHALLASSPAEATGEAHPFDPDVYGKDCCVRCDRGREEHPAPVSSGEAATGEGWERHVSTRCPRMREHGGIKVVDGKVIHLNPHPCPQCYSIESFWHTLPWEPDGRSPAPSPVVAPSDEGGA